VSNFDYRETVAMRTMKVDTTPYRLSDADRFRREVMLIQDRGNDVSLPTPSVPSEALPVPPEAPAQQPVYEPYSKNPPVAEPAYKPYDGI
jgi:hypothetical protein